MAALRSAMPTSAESETLFRTKSGDNRHVFNMGGIRRSIDGDVVCRIVLVGDHFTSSRGISRTVALAESLGEARVFHEDEVRFRDVETGEIVSIALHNHAFVTFDPEHANLPLRPAEIHESNASDAALCYFRGKTIVYFTGSDQQVAGDLQWATFEGPPRQLLEQFFVQSDVDAPSAP